jgi:hypothetical protein
VGSDDFSEYKRLFLHELERLNDELSSLNRKYEQIHIDIITLKTKATVWGGLGGGAIAIITAILVNVVSAYLS